ncbi:MAG: DUF6984 family protein [Brevundimonas sp.]|jgi:hypothetical protein|uniref:DUF6984 family protein n=1 Tax=Brevundimonas sp. TaxID=1871086 RepID=UPI00391AA2F0
MSEAEWRLLNCLLVDIMDCEERVKFRDVEVVTMNDGGMGSFALRGACPGLKKLAVEAMSKDSDGTELLISLFCDCSGKPAEVDIWKVDFSPLCVFPDPETLKFLPPIG